MITKWNCTIWLTFYLHVLLSFIKWTNLCKYLHTFYFSCFMKYLSKANNRISFLRIDNSSIVVLYYCNILSFFVVLLCFCLFFVFFCFVFVFVLCYLLTLFRCHVCSCWKKGRSCHDSVTDRRKTWCSGRKPDQPPRFLWRWCAGSPDPPAAARSPQPRHDFRSQTFRRVSAGGSPGQGVSRSRAPVL